MQNDFYDLSGKTVILTGGAGFLGSVYANAFIRSGANLVLADLNFSKCKRIANSLNKKSKNQCLPVKLDVTNKKSIQTLVSKTVKKFGKIDVLINNAVDQGNKFIRKGGFENFLLSEWNKELSVNLTGIFLCCQEVGKIMVKQKNGVVINISSIYGNVAPDHRIYKNNGLNPTISYSVTKGGIISLTKYLASYWHKDGIRVNTLSLGGVENKQNKEFIKKYSNKTMIGRMAKKDEFTGMLLLLSSDASSYITGSNILIDGGWTSW